MCSVCLRVWLSTVATEVTFGYDIEQLLLVGHPRLSRSFILLAGSEVHALCRSPAKRHTLRERERERTKKSEKEGKSESKERVCV